MVPIFQLCFSVAWEHGNRRGMLFYSSGATICVAFADSYSLNPVYAVMVSNSEIVHEL